MAIPGLNRPGDIAGAGGGSQDLLGGPPPTPQLQFDQERPPTSLADLAPPQINGDVPQPVLQGIVQTAKQWEDQIDGMARITPDVSAEWHLVKLALQRVLARLGQAGASSLSPTSAGSQFPGGGTARTEPGL